jgi:divalent metal cation (Fe/Co/Zn/Cd) transporter
MTILLDAPAIRDAVAQVLCEESETHRILDVTVRWVPGETLDIERAIVLVSVSSPPNLLFGEVAIVLREVAERVRELVPSAERVSVEPRVGRPARETQPATETIVISSSD